jgi:RHS repeat-associated protein
MGAVRRDRARDTVRASVGRLAALATIALFALIVASVAHADPPEGAITFGYDELGRLIESSDPSANTAVYKWDQVGNLIEIGETPSSSLKLSQLAPNSGPVGATVRVYGAGFSATPTQDSVHFNGTAAAVVSATPTELIVTVPSGATTGSVSVTTSAGSATSPEPFTIASSQAPTISSVSPIVTAAGASLSVHGTGFDIDAANDAFGFNQGTVFASSASATSAELTVPGETGSGQLTLETPFGAAGGPDVFVVPPEYEPSEVVQTSRMSLGSLGSNTTQQVTLGTAGGVAMVVFDASQGQRIFAALSNSTISTCAFALYGVHNNKLASTGNCSSGIIDTQTLQGGTYTLLVAASKTSQGAVTLNLYNVPADVSGPIPTDGTTKTVTNTVPGQNGALTFSGSEGQRVFLNIPSCSPCTSPYVEVAILKPDGSTLASKTLTSTSGGYIDTETLPSTGTYTVLVNPKGALLTTITLNLYNVPADVSGSIPTDGTTKTVTNTVPGQNGAVTFSGSVGQRVFLNIPSCSPCTSPYVEVAILKPDGSTLASKTLTSTSGGYIDTETLPATGTYTVLVNPKGPLLTTVTLNLYNVPADVSGSIATDGTTKTVTNTVPGQNGAVTFSGSEGQRVFLNIPSCSPCTSPYVQVSILKPDGSTLASQTVTSSSGGYIDTETLPSSGTYTVLVNPKGPLLTTVTLNLYNVPADISGSIATDGTTKTVTNTVPGQNGAVTFSGSEGQRVFLNIPSCSPCTSPYVQVSILKPDGSTLASKTISGSGGGYIDTETLPSTGTYSVLVDPRGAVLTTITLNLYNVPADISGSIGTDGTTKTVTNTVPGQNGAVTFSGSEGQRVFLNIPSCSPCTSPYVQVSILKPDGSTLVSKTISGSGGGYIDTETLPTTGTYSVLVDPKGAVLTTITLNLYNVPADVSREISIGGAAVGVTTTTPGQAASLAFTGTANKGIHLKTSGDTIGSGCCATKISIKKPDGTTLVSPTYISTSGTTITATLGPAGTYSIVVDPQAAATGNLTLTLTDPLVLTALAERSDAPFGPLYADPLAASAPGVFAPLALAGAPAKSTLSRPERLNVEGGSASRHVRARTASAHPTPRVNRARRSTSSRFALATPRRRRRERTVRYTSPTSSPQAKAPSPVWTPGGANLAGNWTMHRTPTPWQAVPQLQAGQGTALAGQTLQLDGHPLAGVSVSVEDTNASTQTDQTGRFLLSGLPTGHQVLVVDGASADGAGRRYGRFEIGVDVRDNVTNDVGYPIWMPALDEKHVFRLKSPTIGETTLKTPDIPGLQIQIPAGTVITDSAGRRVRELTITAVPVDRPPFPLPLGSEIPLYFTVQPGGAYLSKGARIIYPNYTGMPSGQRVPFWDYDPDRRGWFIYGQGTVSRTGAQIVPDANVRVWGFSGAMISGSPIPPEHSDPECIIPFLCEEGDPVGLNGGLFVMRKTDLALPDVLPISLTRTYRPADNNSYAFGIGMTDNYDLRLWSQENYRTANLILPDGSRIHYVRTSPGTEFANAEYAATETPSPFYGSTIKRYQGWRLTLRNGLIYQFADLSGGLQSIRDRFGNQITIVRAGNTLEKVTSPGGRWMRFSHDSHNRITEVEDNVGRQVKYTYDSLGRLTKVTDPAGGITAYAYSANNAMTTVTDPRGIPYLTNEYDSSGRVTKQELGDGAVYRFSYVTDPETGDVTQATATKPNGAVTQDTFNVDGYPTSVTRATGTSAAQTFSFALQPKTDFLTSSTDPLGHVTSYTYDPAGNVSAITQLAGSEGARTTSFTHDPTYSQLTSVTDPLNHKTSLGYDSSGELTSVTDPLNDTWTAAYATKDGEPTSITDPLGNTTSFSYRAGQPVATTNPLGHTTRRFFDAAGRELSVTNALGDTTRFAYDPFNDLTSVTDPRGGQTRFTYDADGNRESVTDARGNKTAFAYDAMNRVREVTDALGRSDSYSYDGDGNMTSHTDRRGQVTNYGYDPLDRRTFAGFNAHAGPSYESTVAYAYDGDSRLKEAADSNGHTFNLSWDPFNELTEERGPQGTIAYAYNAGGLRTSATVAGQPEVSYGYDAADRLTAIAGTGNVALAYDAAGRPTATTLPDGISENYGYDNASELTAIRYARASTTLGELNYAYDAGGNRTAMWGSYARLNEPQTFTGASYNADNELTSANGTGYEYDPHGNLTNDGINAYTWNARGQLSGLSGGSGSASFSYDPFGRREQASVNGGNTTYLYDGANVAQETAGGSSQTNYLLGLGLDQRYSRRDSNGTQSYLTDALGSSLALADGEGNIKTTYSYDPFGQSIASGESSSNPYQYTGRENDGTGLQYNRARYYSPSQQRFISQDPLGFGGSGANLYAYAGDDPTGLRDPTGRDADGEGLLGALRCVVQSLAGRKNPICIVEKVLPPIAACRGTGALGAEAGGYLGGPLGALGGGIGGCLFGGYVAGEAGEDPSKPGEPPSFPWPF